MGRRWVPVFAMISQALGTFSQLGVQKSAKNRGKIVRNRSSELRSTNFRKPRRVRASQERPREAPRTPKSVQERAKRAQEAARERPRRPQEAPGAPKICPRGSKNGSQEAFGSDAALKKRKPRNLMTLPWFFNDFRGAGGYVLEPKSVKNRLRRRSFRSLGQQKRARAAQERPRATQETTKSVQERAKRAT